MMKKQSLPSVDTEELMSTTLATKEVDRLIGLLDRRRFLSICGKGLGYAALGSTLAACGGGGGSSNNDSSTDSSNNSDTPPEIPIASAELSALKRTSFGIKRTDLNAIQSSGISAYLEQQLDYTNIDDGDLEATIQTLFPSLFQTPAQLLTGFPDNIATVFLHMSGATQYRQIYSNRQLYELMVDFWSNHFNIQLANGLGPTLKPRDDQQVIRAHALGNFGDLLRASAASPAMLFYLDNFDNKAAAPNENYARELMELHTLGVDGGYTEQDIKEVARCFTGWRLRFPGEAGGDYGEFIFDASIHDDDAKTVLGQTIAAGGGKSDGDQVLDILLAHPSTAQFIASKLCRRFITDTPDQSTIDFVASTFTQSNGDIKATLRAVFNSSAFQTTSDTKFTRPSEYLASLIRALAPNSTYPSDNGFLFYIAQAIMGHLPHNWPTPDGYPDEQSYWASTGGMLNRWRLSFLSFAGIIPEINQFQIDYDTLLGEADTLATIVDNLSEAVLMRPLSSIDRTHLLDNLSNVYPFDIDATLPSDLPAIIAPYVAATLISSAYFQLR